MDRSVKEIAIKSLRLICDYDNMIRKYDRYP